MNTKSQKTCILILFCHIITRFNFVFSVSNEELFREKRVLVIGGTGFLGKAIVQEVLKYAPQEVIIFSRDELKHYNAIRFFNNNPKIKSIIGDIRDYDQLLQITKNIDIVFHAAALKRMDALENNVEQTIKTNVLGSLNVFNACCFNNVGKVLFVSSDKACAATNAYGASKFIIEKLFTNYDRRNIVTRFFTIRSGNILDSTGSVIPIFSDQIKRAEDITLTDAHMTRFIVNTKDLVQLMFDALRYGIGGEIFVLKEPSSKITDLIELIKEKYHATNNVKTIGLRPGEKMHEDMLTSVELTRTYDFGQYYVITPTTLSWRESFEVEPIYMQQGKYLNETAMKGFSSDMAPIGKNELRKVLTETGLL